MATKVTRVFNVTGLGTITESDVKKFIVKYLKLKQKQKALEKELSQIGAILKEVANSETNKKVEISEHTISISDCEKKTISYQKLFENHPRIAKKLANVSTYQQLNVK
jgi:hypothetical protein